MFNLDNISYPDKTHYYDSFINSKLYQTRKLDEMKEKFGIYAFNSKTHYDFKKKIRKLNTKPTHSFIPWDIVAEDFKFIKENGLKPDEKGVIHVTRGKTSRSYKIHDVGTSGRLYPVEGDSIVTLPGSKAYDFIMQFFEAQGTDFQKFVNSKSPLNPDRKGA